MRQALAAAQPPKAEETEEELEKQCIVLQQQLAEMATQVSRDELIVCRCVDARCTDSLEANSGSGSLHRKRFSSASSPRSRRPPTKSANAASIPRSMFFLLTLYVDSSGLCCTATRRLRRSLAFMASRWRCGARSTSCSKESRVCARTCRIRDAVAHGAARSPAREPRALRQAEGDCHVVAGSGQQRCQQRVRHPRRVADETLAGWRRTWSRSARAI